MFAGVFFGVRVCELASCLLGFPGVARWPAEKVLRSLAVEGWTACPGGLEVSL